MTENENRYTRTVSLIGEEGLAKLKRSRVAVFGVGGVGGHAAETLARSGIGALDIIDKDVVSESNLNRQIVALTSTLGRPKVEIMAERIADIDPSVKVNALEMFYLPETADSVDITGFDYIVDAIDNVTAKLELISRAAAAGVPVISSMGTGNKLDPSRLRVGDISKTSVCPLAKVMRRELRERGITHLKVVWSDELPKKQTPPGSMAFVPAAAGILLASEVIRDILAG